jgi:hypothetical protein
VRSAAETLFAQIQNADYTKPEQLFAIEYTAHHHFDRWVTWVAARFSRDPIKIVELGPAVHVGAEGRPVLSYRLTLSSGATLQGDLPFDFDPLTERWVALEGLDWHLRDEGG